MWHFREAAYEDTIAESKLNEFFSGEPSEAIVRESFQNSLDAIDNHSAPVRIVLTLGSAAAAGFPEAYETLGEHWQAARHESGAPTSTRYLLIEDFNTKGLLGPIDKEEKPHDSLYSFWWEEGRSKKRTGSGGSHGVGKSTLSGASNSNAFLALTRRSDGDELLIGYSILPPHELGPKEYLGYARFGKRVDRPSDGAKVIYPYTRAEDGEVIGRFRKHAAPKRTDENGLSVFIPDVRDEINEDSLLQAVVENFFFPIIKQSLVVEICNAATGQSVVIEKSNILSLVEGGEYSEEFRSTIEVSLEATRLASKNEFFFLRSDFGLSSENTLSAEAFSDANVKKMQEAFENGDVVSARIEIPLTLSDGKTVSGYADLFARGGEKGGSKTYKAFRGNILIEKEKCRAAQPFSVLILDIFNDDEGNELSEYMKYAEDPGHTEWKNSAQRRSQGRYPGSETWQRHLVQKLGSAFIAILTGTDDQEQIDGFADDIFFVEKEVGPDEPGVPGGNHGQRPGTTAPVPPDIPAPSPQLFRIQRLANGRAAIAGTEHLKEAIEKSGPVRGRVWAANIIFGKSKSNWRKHHHASDFDFAEDGVVESKGASITVRSPNSLDFIAESEEFEIGFNGFDPNRDVHIDVRKVAEATQ
ncbi:hypothetical protein [Croceicoccus gelatinilyticus]|uniref:hypothetical protein n=1 Tax=Croceicoccus gelatinilyticus TaxID=2835536 RepID=UPI001BCD9F13|nr:hypothetical protein [Croceicoccus gelatinilyticus]MBS7669580.1 hypothetical protein [Croceicoccus gelatinilyticus]